MSWQLVVFIREISVIRGPFSYRTRENLHLLRSPRGLEMWFEFALSRRWVRDVDQLRVFTLARCIMRRVDANPRLLDNPCGAFVSQVKRRKWIGIQEDEDWAAKMIQWLDEVEC